LEKPQWTEFKIIDLAMVMHHHQNCVSLKMSGKFPIIELICIVGCRVQQVLSDPISSLFLNVEEVKKGWKRRKNIFVAN
jgi:hypothetical protein